MMALPRSLTTLASSSLFALSGLLASAQSAPRVLPGPLPDGLDARNVPVRMVRATYDLADDVVHSVVELPAGIDTFGTAPPCFDNSDLFCDMSPVEPYSIGNAPGDELLDWGVKQCGGTGMVQSITIAYRTTAVDVSFGGPGATFSFALYRGTRGFNRVGTEVFRHTFTRLPGVAPGTGTHEALFGFVTIDFGDTPISLPDGPIGWGYLLLDNLVAATATGALLVTAPNATTGVIDALDVYSPGPATTGVYTGTFNFASTCNHPPCCPHASTWLQIVETTPAGVAFNGTGVNPAILSEVLPARLGQAWAGRFDLSGYSGATETLIWVSLADQSPTTSPFGEILIDPAWRIAREPFVANGFNVLPVPRDPALSGLVLYAQGGIRTATGGIVLTNGLKTTLGF